MRRRVVQDEPDDVLLEVSGGRGVDQAGDEILEDDGRPPRRWPVALGAVLATAAVVVAVLRSTDDDSAPVADSTQHAIVHPVVPRHLPWPEGGFTADIPGQCPSKVFCTVVATSKRVQVAIRRAVVSQIGAPRQLQITTRMRPATVSDHRSMYTRVITARVGGAHVKIVVSRSPIDPANDSVLAGGRADVRYESELSGFEIVGVIGVPGTLTRQMFFGLTRLVDDSVLIAGRT